MLFKPLCPFKRFPSTPTRRACFLWVTLIDYLLQGLLSFVLCLPLGYFFPTISHLTHWHAVHDGVAMLSKSNFRSFFELNETIFWAELDASNLWKHPFLRSHPNIWGHQSFWFCPSDKGDNFYFYLNMIFPTTNEMEHLFIPLLAIWICSLICLLIFLSLQISAP